MQTIGKGIRSCSISYTDKLDNDLMIRRSLKIYLEE